MLRQTLEGFAKISQAEESSLFWLDDQGYVTESILARGIAIREQKDSVVGQVLENGLAGWVYRKKMIAVVTDTAQDERWLELPFQPYVAKSILCVPVIRGSHLLAIATLMHSEVGYFDEAKVELVKLCASRLAMVLDLLRLQGQVAEEKQAMEQNAIHHLEMKDISQFVLSEEGKFVYVDPQLSEIFGYEVEELTHLTSFFDLVAVTHREAFSKKLALCFQGDQSQILVTFRGITKKEKSLRIEFYGHRTRLKGMILLIGRLREMS
ncbi:MAG: GAF domain-containing protein [Limnothrix sp. RL_2_0]|nr:GAF domain-containing protein [Limnothrix sp. RL_2_0]